MVLKNILKNWKLYWALQNKLESKLSFGKSIELGENIFERPHVEPREYY